MRVLAATPTFFPIVGGAELLIRDVLNLWSAEHEVRLITPHLPPGSEAFWVEDVVADPECRFDVVRFDDTRTLMDWRGHRASRGLIPPMSLSAASAIRTQIDEFGADVLVTFFAVPLGLPSLLASSLRRVPLVLVLCGNDIPGPRTRRVPMWASYIRQITARAARAVYVSDFCFGALERHAFASPHDMVVHGGVDHESMRPTSPGAPQALRERHGLGPDDVMLFALQRLAPEKRVDVLIRAFAATPPGPTRAKLFVGGQGTQAQCLRELAESLGVADRVVFTGHLGSEKADYYHACDAFVFHSIFETFGQVIAEAMTCGKPVVSVRAGAIPEVVDDGVTGLLSAPNDHEAMARSIERVVGDADLRRRMGEAGLAKACREYDWRRVSGEWDGLLDFVARPDPRSVPDGERFAIPGVGDRTGERRSSW